MGSSDREVPLYIHTTRGYDDLRETEPKSSDSETKLFSHTNLKEATHYQGSDLSDLLYIQWSLRQDSSTISTSKTVHKHSQRLEVILE